MRIAFLGTGIMGAPMARHISTAGNEVTAWNRSAEKARPLEEHGVRVVEDPAEALRGADVIVTMLADGPVTLETMRGAAGAATAGAVWWQAATVGIEPNAALAALAAEHGLRYVDGPVMGTRGPAEAGQLIIMAAGEDEALDVCQPLFDAAGSRTMRVGEAGRATLLKLVMNHWVVGLTGALAETIVMAEGLGVDPSHFLEVIAGGPIDVGYAQMKGPGMIAGDVPMAFPLKLALKDINLMIDAGAANGLDLALARTVRDRYVAALEGGHGEQDMGMVVEGVRAGNAKG